MVLTGRQGIKEDLRSIADNHGALPACVHSHTACLICINHFHRIFLSRLKQRVLSSPRNISLICLCDGCVNESYYFQELRALKMVKGGFVMDVRICLKG